MSTLPISRPTMNIAAIVPKPRGEVINPVSMTGYSIRFCSIDGISASVPLRIPPIRNISTVPVTKFGFLSRSRLRNDRSVAVIVWVMNR